MAASKKPLPPASISLEEGPDLDKAEATVEELAGMIERGELRLPELQRRYVWRSTRALTATVSSHFRGLIDRGLLHPLPMA